MIADHYEYPFRERYNETVAVMPNGDRINIDVQYGVASPLGQHAADCSLKAKIGGRCDCGRLNGIDVPALIAEARDAGKIGSESQSRERAEWDRLKAQHPDASDDEIDEMLDDAEEWDDEGEDDLAVAPVAAGRRGEWSPCPRCGTYCQGDCTAN